ncbi:hypothetical protein D9613_008572 [Agrocybe pediades]|uniref:Uncharacterized protein n=1 Tax=Agrocybe pediades TaxID=84607 RepID=A0A8H4VNV4_9AGAR|nr:hypothetical protein D9613_008572 [Agrocybe pediades]
MQPHANNEERCPFTAEDALRYLNTIKLQFKDKPDVYQHFLDIMKEFRNAEIDTPGVMKRVSHLFSDHQSLIHGFNQFLPDGCYIDCDRDVIIIRTPLDHNEAGPPSGPASPDQTTYGMLEPATEPARQYVQKIKQRCSPETYHEFVDILSQHHKSDILDEEEVFRQIERLFEDKPDLRADLRVFMPDRNEQLMDDTVPDVVEFHSFPWGLSRSSRDL